MVSLSFRQHASCSEPGTNPHLGRIYASGSTQLLWPDYPASDVSAKGTAPYYSGDCSTCFESLSLLDAYDTLHGNRNACDRGPSAAVITRVICTEIIP